MTYSNLLRRGMEIKRGKTRVEEATGVPVLNHMEAGKEILQS